MNENSREIEYLPAAWEGCDQDGWNGPGWYFWDETWANCHGPYLTREEAVAAVIKYAESL
jgi:hypothetical protein